MSTSDTKRRATLAAWTWLGTYETLDPDAPDDARNLDAAFETYGTASRVKANCDFPEDMVDAYAMLRRMAYAQERARR